MGSLFAAWMTIGGLHKQTATEQAVIEKRFSANIVENENKGTFWVNPIMTRNVENFSTVPNRITVEIPVTAKGNVEMILPFSMRWSPDFDNTVEAYRYARDKAGVSQLSESEPGLMNQIEDKYHDTNGAMFANSYSELRNYVNGVASLIPPEQLKSQAALDQIHDAVMNGYNPKEVYEKFNPDDENPDIVVDDKEVPSFEEMLIQSFGGKDYYDIKDGDARKADFKNQTLEEEYNKIAEKDIELKNAQKDVEIATEKGRAQVEAAKKAAEAARELDTEEAKEQRQWEIWSETVKESDNLRIAPPPPNGASTQNEDAQVVYDVSNE